MHFNYFRICQGKRGRKAKIFGLKDNPHIFLKLQGFLKAL